MCSAIKCSRQAGVIEITPEMIEAGERALYRYGKADKIAYWIEPAELAAKVYRAMREATHASSLRRATPR